MKNNLSANINLTKSLIPLIFVIIAYAMLIFTIVPTSPYKHLALPSFIGFFASLLIFSFMTTKGILNGISIENEPLKFNGSLWKFILIHIGYSLLSIITIGMATPVLIKKAHSFMVDNTTLKNESFQFKGKSRAMVIFMAIFIIAYIAIIIGITVSGLFPMQTTQSPLILFAVIYPILLLFICFTSAYIYHWYVNISYKGYNLHFKSTFYSYITPWVATIFGTIFSLGLASPFLNLWIAKKYINDLEATSQEKTITFSEEFQIKKDGFYLFGQTLLTIITLGIFMPFAYQNIYNRLIPKIAYTKEA
ncbi:DUF898 family protein [Prolixibacteraceae bacterium]|nr:DUF898 family protein [Prolixibacteraceae bacterium]